MSFILSKSSFVRGLQCEKSLFLSKYKKKLKDPVSPELQKKFDGGRSFEDDFRKTLGEGINVAETCYFNQYVNKTLQLIQGEEPLIFEATFEHNEVLVMVDALERREDGTYVAYEVKNSTALKPVHRNDLGVQLYVLKNAIKELKEFYLVLNKDGQFEKINLMDELRSEMGRIDEEVARLKTVITDKVEPQVAMGAHCHDPYDCDFIGYCSSSMF